LLRKKKNALTALLNGVLGENALMDQDQDPKLLLKKLLVQELLVQNYPLKMRNVLTVLLPGEAGMCVVAEKECDLRSLLYSL